VDGAADWPLLSDTGVQRILIVDDLDDHRVILRYYLRTLAPFEILEAANGQQALALVSREPLDLVIMNLGMPLLDGWEATRRIRALPGAARAVPILALTAYALPSAEQRARAAGCDAYLTKPIVDVTLLRQTVRQLLARGRTP
jgi:two-component system cell cycle response regulator DivK